MPSLRSRRRRIVNHWLRRLEIPSMFESFEITIPAIPWWLFPSVASMAVLLVVLAFFLIRRRQRRV
jgi:hypothetical protein